MKIFTVCLYFNAMILLSVETFLKANKNTMLEQNVYYRSTEGLRDNWNDPDALSLAGSTKEVSFPVSVNKTKNQSTNQCNTIA